MLIGLGSFMGVPNSIRMLYSTSLISHRLSWSL